MTSIIKCMIQGFIACKFFGTTSDIRANSVTTENQRVNKKISSSSSYISGEYRPVVMKTFLRKKIIFSFKRCIAQAGKQVMDLKEERSIILDDRSKVNVNT
jgi:hypothetical protein